MATVEHMHIKISVDCSQALAALDRAEAVIPLWCCEIDCPQPAVVRIIDTRQETPYDVAETHACADHVRALGGEDPHTEVVRFDR